MRAAKPKAGKRKVVERNAAEVRAQTRAAKAKFDAAHVKGMRALKDRDYKTFGGAVHDEWQAIEALPKPKRKTTKRGSV